MERERERDRETETETERDRERQRERETETERDSRSVFLWYSLLVLSGNIHPRDTLKTQIPSMVSLILRGPLT